MDVKISHSEQVAKSSFTKHLGILHRRDAETAETSQRGGGKRLLIPSPRSLCVLCASAVNCSSVFLALLSFQLWPFSVKEFLATYLERSTTLQQMPRNRTEVYMTRVFQRFTKRYANIIGVLLGLAVVSSILLYSG